MNYAEGPVYGVLEVLNQTNENFVGGADWTKGVLSDALQFPMS